MNNTKLRCYALTISLATLLTVPAFASEFSLGKLSPVGTTIEVESYRCEATSRYTIECVNIGRVCELHREEDKTWHDKIFGCGIEGNPTYPCPPEEQFQQHMKEDMKYRCDPFVMGGY